MISRWYVRIEDFKDVNGQPLRVYFDSMKVCRQVQDLVVRLGFTCTFGKEFK